MSFDTKKLTPQIGASFLLYDDVLKLHFLIFAQL